MELSLDERLDRAVEKRDRLAAKVQKIKGLKEAADKALRELEDEIRAKNLDPDTLDESIEKLSAAYEKAVDDFEKEVNQAREALEPFLE